MDNLTHTVIGAIAGEALARFLPGRAGSAGTRRRPLYVAAGIIGGNLPDLDLLYSYRGRPHEPLTYLLGHRGYTHTVVGCLLLAAILAALLWWYARRRGPPLTAAERARLFGVALISTGLHLAMDALNSYGVHPFWPLDDRWVYGDAVYIVEPWYWSAAAPLILIAQSRLARSLLIGLQLLAVGAALLTGLVPLPGALALGAFSILLLLACRAAPQQRAAAAGALAFLGVTALFVVGGRVAQAQLRSLAAAELPAGQLVDIVLNPLPADPLCWDALRLTLEGERYVVRRAVIALAPALIPAGACRDQAIDATGAARWSAPRSSDAGSLRWREWSMRADDLVELVRRHCRAAALMQFVRVPFVSRESAGVVLGDLRFDGARGGSFAQLRFADDESGEACPAGVPWLAPRAALLERR